MFRLGLIHLRDHKFHHNFCDLLSQIWDCESHRKHKTVPSLMRKFHANVEKIIKR